MLNTVKIWYRNRNRNRNQNRNFPKVGTGTAINHYGSKTLLGEIGNKRYSRVRKFCELKKQTLSGADMEVSNEET
jgi:hypothetical protein